MFQLEFRGVGSEKWALFGDDGNEFDSVSEAWEEALLGAKIGAPYNGAEYRVIDLGGEHADDCSLGLGPYVCDCREPIVVEQGRVSWDGLTLRTVLSPIEGLSEQRRKELRTPSWAGATRVEAAGGVLRELDAVSLYPVGVGPGKVKP